MPWAEVNVVTTRAGIPRHRSTVWKGQSKRVPARPRFEVGAGRLAFSMHPLSRHCLKCHVKPWKEEGHGQRKVRV